MEVAFRSNKMRRCYEDSAQAIRTWGAEVGRRYIRRVATLYEMRDFSEVFRQPSWRTHPLKGGRAGQYAINLTGQWRLIVTMSGTDGAVTVEEVSNHYD